MLRSMLPGPARATAAMLVLPWAPLHAQALPDSLAGHRVRVQLVKQAFQVEGNAPGQGLRGTVVAVTADSLTLRIHPSAAPFAVAASAIRRIEVSRGVRTRADGAVGGAMVGALSWGSSMYLMNSLAREPAFDNDWHAAAVGAAIGGVVGGIVGAVAPLERWKKLRWRNRRP